MAFHCDLVVASEAFGESMFQKDSPACIIGTSGAQLVLLHKEYLYFLHLRLQKVIITYEICVFSAFEIARCYYRNRNMCIFSFEIAPF